jgi:predicted ArsR family transcriptional regulator
MATALDLVTSDTRRDLLQLIKREGSLTVDEAMEALGMARTTVRDHLLRLREKGLLTRSAEREGRGRPRHRYEMSPQASVLFPSRDEELLGAFIRFLRERGDEAVVEAFFEAYWEERTQAVKERLERVADGDLGERLEILRSVLEEEGFMPVIDAEDGAVTIRECNCPFPEAVKETKIPCRLERSFFESLFETELERVKYIPEGHPACTYTLSVESAGAETASAPED